MLLSAAKDGKKIVLHVGSGPDLPTKLNQRFKNAEWREVRLDIDPNVKPDIIASMTDMKVVESGAVDAVWSSHNLEHLFAHEVPVCLAEFYRVLKPGGYALITLPDMLEIAKLIAEDKLEEPTYVSAAGPIAPIDMVFGFRPALASGHVFMAHRTAFTAKTLHRALMMAKFAPVRVIQGPPGKYDLWAEAFKGEAQAAR